MMLTPVGAVLALVFAVVVALRVLKFSEGTEKMAGISAKVCRGANAYLRRQYSIVAVFFTGMFALLCILAFAFRSKGLLTPYVPFAFVTGGFFSGLSGFIGMKIATAANARTAHTASHWLSLHL
ncbi:MAG: sodium/proton-translocating pyrophosphatase [Oscillospiraceae bacterium]|jgi:K(+)-stimulated pyrophosphate-energized sodium pump|nr:sodium/proton-translocating pyrophosphatase [Oscillospiraceae bacterium]